MDSHLAGLRHDKTIVLPRFVDQAPAQQAHVVPIVVNNDDPDTLLRHHQASLFHGKSAVIDPGPAQAR